MVNISTGHRRYWKIYVIRKTEKENKCKITTNSQRGNTTNVKYFALIFVLYQYNSVPHCESQSFSEKRTFLPKCEKIKQDCQKIL
jgi:hypothetical protein